MKTVKMLFFGISIMAGPATAHDYNFENIADERKIINLYIECSKREAISEFNLNVIVAFGAGRLITAKEHVSINSFDLAMSYGAQLASEELDKLSPAEFSRFCNGAGELVKSTMDRVFNGMP
jgi:hypothetical protein